MALDPNAVEALAQFARWAITESAFNGHDLDGAEVQAEAERLGLIKATVYDPERHGPSDAAEPGMDWYEFTAYLQHAGEAEPVGYVDRLSFPTTFSTHEHPGIEMPVFASPHPHQAPGAAVECATAGCGKLASVRFERGGVGSWYCGDCYAKVQAVSPHHPSSASPSKQASASADQGGE